LVTISMKLYYALSQSLTTNLKLGQNGVLAKHLIAQNVRT
jgi:hypothetical protein